MSSQSKVILNSKQLELTIERLSFEIIENFKNLNSKNLKVLHESRFIESLYFDTWDLELYKSSFNLDIDKYKYRLRKGIDGKIYSEIKMNKANGKFKEKNLTHFKSLDQTESIFYSF